MKLDLLSLELEGFRSFRDHTFVDFEAHGSGLHFVRGRNEAQPRLGPNGVGKSSIFDCVLFALYGRTVRGLKGPDVRTWGREGSTTVSVRLRCDDAIITVNRRAAPNALEINGKGTSQEAVEGLIGLNADAFTATMLLGQGRPLFFDLPPRDKMDLFSAVLDLERWDERSKRASNATEAVENKIRKANNDLREVYAEQDQLKDLIAENKRKIEEWREEQNERIKWMNEDLGRIEKEFESISTKKGVADATFDMAETELRAIVTNREKVQKMLHYAQVELAKLIQLNETSQKTLDHERNGLKLAKAKKQCPTCGAPMKPDHKHLRQTERELLELEQVLEDAKPTEKKLRGHVADFEKELQHLREAEVKHKDKRDTADKELRLLTPACADLEARINAIKEMKNERTSERNPFGDVVRDLKKRMTKLDDEAHELDKRIGKLEVEIEHSRYWIKGFKSVRLYIIDEVLQEFELATNAMLEEVGLIGWCVKYDIERETKSGTIQQGLNVLILSPANEQPVKWESWSGGEGQRLRLISALALSDVLLNNAGVEPTFEILDEPTQHLSTEGVRDLCDYLSERARAYDRQVWFVDHHAIESARFSSTLTVVKDMQGSHIDGGRVTEASPMPDKGKGAKPRVRFTSPERAGTRRK